MSVSDMVRPRRRRPELADGPPLSKVIVALCVSVLPSLALFVSGLVAFSLASGDAFWEANFLGFLALVIGAPVAYLNAFVFGLPTYLLLRRRFATTFLACAIGGAATAIAPLALLSLAALLFNLVGLLPVSAFVLGGVGVVGPLPLALLGALAGVVFRWRLGPDLTAPTAPPNGV